MKKGTFIAVIVADIVIILVFIFGFREGRKHPIHTGPVIITDTLVITDTITIKEPIVETRRVIDSVLVAVKDTIHLRDTLFVLMEKEQVIWEDSLAVVYASGINTQVDSVAHRLKVIQITKEMPVIQKSRWGIGVQTGMGVSKEGLSPYIGVGISYNLISW